MTHTDRKPRTSTKPAAAKPAPALPTPKLNPSRLYSGDNGRIHCGALYCAGSTAHFTGRGLDGGPCVLVDAAYVAERARVFKEMGYPPRAPRCEDCGKTYTAKEA